MVVSNGQLFKGKFQKIPPKPTMLKVITENIPGELKLVSRKKCTNPCSCETIVCTIPVASAAWCDRQA